MENLERLTIAEMKEFVDNNEHISCEAVEPEARYGFIERVPKRHQYRRLRKGQRGIVRRFLAKITGLSRAQLTRLVQRWMEERHIERKPPRRRQFPRRYTAEDIMLLARVDEAHEDLSGPAVRHILEREYRVYGKQAYERLSRISVSHICNLRGSAGY